jgi:hypothetical protein
MTDDHKALLKELVDAPFGQAETILKSKGMWDERRKPKKESTLCKYRVKVTGEMQVSAIVTVEAYSQEEAEDFALDDASKPGFQWRDFDDVDIIGTEIESAVEA